VSTSSAAAATPDPTPTPWPRLVIAAIGLAAVVVTIVLAFLWPSVTSSAKNVPIVVAGPPAATDALVGQLKDKVGDTFALDTVGDRSAAVAAIKERTAYGAIVVEGAAPEVLTASAASPIISAALTQVAAQLQGQLQAAADAQAKAAGISAPTITVAVTDVVPLASTDTTGSGIAAASFPLLLGGLIGGVAITIAMRGAVRRLTGLSIYAVVGGFGLVGVLQGWFGILQGDYFANVGAVALALAAIAAPIIGATSVIGIRGIALGPVIFLLFANPISSAIAPQEFLPGAWGAVGQWFPPGAGSTLLRDLSYFPGANTVFPWLVLAGWAVLGYLLAMFGHFRNRSAALERVDSGE
jgi:hypothetical protein